jgi:hypothetical protein
MPNVNDEQFHKIAEAALIDRLSTFGYTADSKQGKNGPAISRQLPPTANEQRWDSLVDAMKPKRSTDVPHEYTVHPGVVAVARQAKRARTT